MIFWGKAREQCYNMFVSHFPDINGHLSAIRENEAFAPILERILDDPNTITNNRLNSTSRRYPSGHSTVEGTIP